MRTGSELSALVAPEATSELTSPHGAQFVDGSALSSLAALASALDVPGAQSTACEDEMSVDGEDASCASTGSAANEKQAPSASVARLVLII